MLKYLLRCQTGNCRGHNKNERNKTQEKRQQNSRQHATTTTTTSLNIVITQEDKKIYKPSQSNRKYI